MDIPASKYMPHPWRNAQGVLRFSAFLNRAARGTKRRIVEIAVGKIYIGILFFKNGYWVFRAVSPNHPILPATLMRLQKIIEWTYNFDWDTIKTDKLQTTTGWKAFQSDINLAGPSRSTLYRCRKKAEKYILDNRDKFPKCADLMFPGGLPSTGHATDDAPLVRLTDVDKHD